ncbi:LOW QUALITY PROTEIN: uncharacterized protein EMH_0060840 [Eimeria mitis]|uniref:Uncharacterized protein n=1 Tax=Eimeria mitis TaxID=44415 RepID=U6K312_9EIME|nr:LOW QUALITY PROTEIN: uncharacterized protein EMH_0060840 [Eimeria mitis]CDJ30722.1 hypothetical protein EMH_0060840 [Eimeria mitis]
MWGVAVGSPYARLVAPLSPQQIAEDLKLKPESSSSGAAAAPVLATALGAPIPVSTIFAAGVPVSGCFLHPAAVRLAAGISAFILVELVAVASVCCCCFLTGETKRFSTLPIAGLPGGAAFLTGETKRFSTLPIAGLPGGAAAGALNSGSSGGAAAAAAAAAAAVTAAVTARKGSLWKDVTSSSQIIRLGLCALLQLAGAPLECAGTAEQPQAAQGGPAGKAIRLQQQQQQGVVGTTGAAAASAGAPAAAAAAAAAGAVMNGGGGSSIFESADERAALDASEYALRLSHLLWGAVEVEVARLRRLRQQQQQQQQLQQLQLLVVVLLHRLLQPQRTAAPAAAAATAAAKANAPSHAAAAAAAAGGGASAPTAAAAANSSAGSSSSNSSSKSKRSQSHYPKPPVSQPLPLQGLPGWLSGCYWSEAELPWDRTDTDRDTDADVARGAKQVAGVELFLPPGIATSCLPLSCLLVALRCLRTPAIRRNVFMLVPLAARLMLLSRAATAAPALAPGYLPAAPLAARDAAAAAAAAARGIPLLWGPPGSHAAAAAAAAAAAEANGWRWEASEVYDVTGDISYKLACCFMLLYGQPLLPRQPPPLDKLTIQTTKEKMKNTFIEVSLPTTMLGVYIHRSVQRCTGWSLHENVSRTHTPAAAQ